MGKKYLLLFLLIFSLSFVSADYGNTYRTINSHSFNNPTYYENENRFQTYDYRHGYTYRSTDEFRRTHNSIYISYQGGNSHEQRAPYYSHNHERNSYYDNNHDRSDRDYRYQGHHQYGNNNNRFRNPTNEIKSHYHRYNPYRNSYTEIECYNSPPMNILFYRRCP